MAENIRDIESDEESDLQLEWLLGFAEPAQNATEILRHNFPSKIGGRPAWLEPVHLPTKNQLTCKPTGEQLQFLLQAS